MPMELTNFLLSLWMFLLPVPANAATALTATQTSIVYGSDDCYAFNPTTRYVVNSEIQLNATVESAVDEGLYFSLIGTGAVSTGGFGNNNVTWDVRSGATSGGYATVFGSSNDTASNGLALSATRQCIKWRSAAIDTDLLQRMEIIGFGSTATNGTGYASGGASSCVCFRIDVTVANTNLIAVTKLGATETTTDTGVIEVLDTMNSFEIVATSTSVTFFINGAAVATHTTNIPTAIVFPVFSTRSKAAGSRGTQLDWVQYARPRS